MDIDEVTKVVTVQSQPKIISKKGKKLIKIHLWDERVMHILADVN